MAEINNNSTKKVESITVERILQDKVRPLLLNHGGDIELLDITEENAVHVRLRGKCSCCPSAHITLETIVEDTLKNDCPEIKCVVADVSISKDLIDYAKSILNKS